MNNRTGFLLLLVFFSLFNMGTLLATHYRAGEISYVQLSDLTIRATLTTYTKSSSVSADTDSIDIDWGDGFVERIGRTIIGGTNVSNDVKISYFTKEHTYPGRATYTIGFSDPNRTGNILNVNWPNSVEIPFFISTRFTLLDTQFQGKNSSVVLLQPPIDIACVNESFIHNPNAYDPDGDSLSYELITPLATMSEVVPFYKLPSDIAPGLNNIVHLDPETGDFTWEKPQIQGEYSIAIRINEFRDGVLVNSMIRDMQILVVACISAPPVIEVVEEICVIAGDELKIGLVISDPDEGQLVKLTATGSVFDLPLNQAVLDKNPTYNNVPFDALFSWQTTCNDIKIGYYQVVFRAVDDFFGTSGLATLKTVRIKVVGPPPILKSVKPSNSEMRIDWEEPYDCDITDNGFFQGFSIWRKEGAGTSNLDSCDIGIGESGYKKIKAITKDKDAEGYFYIDKTVELNKSYCYRILGEFATLTDVGYPYNPVSSLRSNEYCATLSGNVPTLIKTSVINTDTNTGIIDVTWIPPSSILLDTITYKAPYRYELSRSDHGVDNYQTISGASMSQLSLLTPQAFHYTDIDLNTFTTQYDYQVDFYIVDNQYFETSIVASSIWLSIIATDTELNLSWNSTTPWVNHTYYLWGYNDVLNDFELIDSTKETKYNIPNLINGQEYCYKIEAHGSYDDELRHIDDIINFSQEACGIPNDNEPPCPPILKIESVCDKEFIDLSSELLYNRLFWTDPIDNCENKEDISAFRVYYKLDSNNYELLTTIPIDEERSYDHFPENTLAGCYVVTALDLKGNESDYSNEICVDNCSLYELPNTFTPNGDGHNDLFYPIKNYFVSSIDFKLYNRWGTMIFSTTDPSINWDGNNAKGKPFSPGVYYYTCQIFDSNVNQKGKNSVDLNGVIHLIRGE